jgi:hypothetical protein
MRDSHLRTISCAVEILQFLIAAAAAASDDDNDNDDENIIFRQIEVL